MIAVVSIRNIVLASDNSIAVEFTAIGAWGQSLADTATVSLTGSLGQIAGQIKTRVIQWASGLGVTLAPSQVWLGGLVDDQVSGVRKVSDDTTQSTSFSDVPGLQFQLEPNSHYKFDFDGGYTAVGATTGLQLSVNGPAAPDVIRFTGWLATSATATFNGAGGAYDAAIAATASGGATALPFGLVGSISTGTAGGAFGLRFRSETNGNAVTILRGSIGTLTAVR